MLITRDSITIVRRDKWIDVMLDKIGNGDKDSGALFISMYLAKNFKTSFLCAAKQIGVHIAYRMIKEVAPAMWKNVNVTQKAAKTVYSHLSFAFGSKIQVPMKELNTLGDGYVEPFFDSFLYELKGGKGKK